MIRQRMRKFVCICGMLALGMCVFVPQAKSADDKGVKLFHDKCSVCHGDDGRGSDVGKDLGVVDLHSAAVQSQSDAQLIDAVTNGKGKMPPNKSRLTAAQIKIVVGYVREFGKKK